jgi:hypothetical protein
VIKAKIFDRMCDVIEFVVQNAFQVSKTCKIRKERRKNFAAEASYFHMSAITKFCEKVITNQL